jgi:simple sugar transport system permease protein
VSALEAILSAAMLGQTLRMAVPYACAALGGVWSERSGVVNIALEGGLLTSGLCAVAAAHATSSALVGLLAGVATGAAFTGAHGLIVVFGRVDAIVSGIALNLVAAGGTRFLLRALYHSSSNSPAVEGFRLGALEGASGMKLLFRTLVDPTTLLTVLATVLSGWMLLGTRFGLRVRAVGEDPVAASSVGVPVARVRLGAVLLGGAICGLGGAALALDQHQFQAGMSGGRGFIALAAVILSGWRPGRAVAACVAFAALDAAQVVLQAHMKTAQHLLPALPYAATLASLVLLGRTGAARGQGRAPGGLGKHVD